MVVEHPATGSARATANLIIAFVLLGVLIAANGTWSAASEVRHRLRLVTDYTGPQDVLTATSIGNAVPRPPDTPTAIDPSIKPSTELAAELARPTSNLTAVVPVVTDTTVDPGEPASLPGTASAPVVSASSHGTAPPDQGSAGVSRPVPKPVAASAAPVVSPWADSSRITDGGYLATDLGCASGTSAAALDAFFRDRLGPVIGMDYQHVYPLGASRYLWIFQDTFVDYSGTATSLGAAAFDHNTAMVQDGSCFTLLHRGSIQAPSSFEPGTGEDGVATWFWPMGGETVGGKVYVFWAEMQEDGYEPSPANGLGWHPARTWLAVYDAKTLARLDFGAAPNSGVAPIYGYAVSSDADYTYLFGNTFEQNLQREGGYANGPHSGTNMWLARVPKGQFGAPLEYRAGDTWTYDAARAQPILQRYWAENPMQPRYLNGQWVAATKVNGYWGESLAIDVANDPWGPWTTVESHGISPRAGDPLMNTYHAYLMPWLDGGGSLVVSISQNARNMLRDAWPDPARYRLAFFRAALVTPPPREDLNATSTTVEDTTTTSFEAATTVPTTIVVTATTTTSTTPTTPTTTTTSTTPTTTTTTTTTTSTTTTSTSTSTTSTSTSTSTTATTAANISTNVP